MLKQIQRIIDTNMELYLPHVKKNDLEKNGAIFYMNGQNGTEFDWYVNGRLPFFMVFYQDKDNLGAVKLILSRDGKVVLYLYDDNGKKLIQEVHTAIEAQEAEMLNFAAIMKHEADDKSLWDADIEQIHADVVLDGRMLDQFKAQEENYQTMRNRKQMLGLTAYVSKKLLEEGWKVGYMERSEPCHPQDSGWFFAVGNEKEEDLSSAEKIELLHIGTVWQQVDSDILKYVDMPIGTKLIRISSDTFEIDRGDKAIYMEKAK